MNEKNQGGEALVWTQKGAGTDGDPLRATAALGDMTAEVVLSLGTGLWNARGSHFDGRAGYDTQEVARGYAEKALRTRAKERITDATACLSVLSPSEQPEPVIWDYAVRFRGEQWKLAEEFPPDMAKAIINGLEGWEAKPLYAQPSKQTGGGGWIKASDRPDTKGDLWLAANNRGQVWPGVFVNHRVPGDAAFVQRIVMPDLAALSTNEVAK